MLSYNINVLTSDAHLIFDKNTKEKINQNKDIIIGNHVWIGMNAMILKGVEIKDNSIIGAYSLVTKKFCNENIIVAGNPAKIIKENIEWQR
ncbi:hypothetical protein AGMMS50267_09910 [Spirochaetia bacterium]|nr:hypothetical protein AGMMS50267_09910 [Spirochaetia bacterium]